MEAIHIFCLYLLLFILYFSVEFILQYLQHKVLKDPPALPTDLADSIDYQTVKKSVDYSVEKSSLGLIEHFYSAAILLLFVILGWFGSFHDYVANFFENKYLIGIFYTFLLLLIFKIIAWPIELRSIFGIEAKYGFNKMTVGLWLLDQVKALLISIALLTPLLLLLFWFVYNTGSLWWLWGFCLVAIFQVFVVFIYPVWIAPIFNKFTAIEEGELKDGIFELAKKADFPLTEVSIMDASKRSSHGNAYFTGFGKNQKIVLFDTLKKDLNTKELLAVLAHEIGHKKLGHVIKLLCFQTVLMFLIFFVLGWLYNQKVFFEAFAFSSVSPEAALIIFSIAFSPITYFLTPLFSLLQRKYEYQADRFANDLVGNAESLRSALINLYKANLSNFFPHPWYSFFHHSHPTLVERLKAF